VREGWITATPGKTIQHDFLNRDILEDAKKYHIKMVAFDPYYSREIEKITSEMMSVEFEQGLKHFAAPTKAWERDILDGKIIDNNPVIRWNLQCATIKPDANGNYKPLKRKGASSSERIDGIITSIMAHSLASRVTISDDGIGSERLFNLLGV
jgi:phage terminase large subunit-like protein